LLANLNAEFGKIDKADAGFKTARDLAVSDPGCAARVKQVANAYLSAIRQTAPTPVP
jgi:hypothetical protein